MKVSHLGYGLSRCYEHFDAPFSCVRQSRLTTGVGFHQVFYLYSLVVITTMHSYRAPSAGKIATRSRLESTPKVSSVIQPRAPFLYIEVVR